MHISHKYFGDCDNNTESADDTAVGQHLITPDQRRLVISYIYNIKWLNP